MNFKLEYEKLFLLLFFSTGILFAQIIPCDFLQHLNLLLLCF